MHELASASVRVLWTMMFCTSEVISAFTHVDSCALFDFFAAETLLAFSKDWEIHQGECLRKCVLEEGFSRVLNHSIKMDYLVNTEIPTNIDPVALG